uniref:Uncharacterized protein n=1 Tax=Oryza punctata TaxID=4537 RepID=A0A0E0M8V4_ORYPU
MAMAAAAAMVFLVVAPSLVQAEEPPTAAHPHGLPFESPLALSPDAYEFFHPSERARRGHAAGTATAPALTPRAAPRGQLRESAASVARADQEEGGVAPVRKVRRGCVRAGTVAGVVVGAAAVAAVAALAVAYAVARRRVGVAHGDAEACARAAPKPSA